MKFETYLFDIDHTLYPFSQGIENWFSENIGKFVAEKFNVPSDKALEITEDYYKLFGSTLPGLMYFHDVTPEEFYKAKGKAPLDAVIKHSPAMEHVRALDGRKIAFTNASRAHGVHVLEHLGLLDDFEAIFGLDCVGFWGKPHNRSYEHVLKETGLNPATTAFFEDSPRNLIHPRSLGMTTVLIGEGYHAIGDAPDFVSVHTRTLSEALEAVDAL